MLNVSCQSFNGLLVVKKLHSLSVGIIVDSTRTRNSPAPVSERDNWSEKYSEVTVRWKETRE